MHQRDKDFFFMRLQKLNNSGIRFNSRSLGFFDNMLVIYNKKLEDITPDNFRQREWKQGVRLSDLGKPKILIKQERCFSVSFPKNAVFFYQAY